MSFLDNLWYGRTISSFLLRIPLLPLSSVFAFVAAARRSMYSNGLLHSQGPVVPVVVVGGITVGGTGKTPLCIAIVNELKARGYKPGVLTRGYKSKCSEFPCQVPFMSQAEIYGDEPSLIRKETRVPVVIDPERTRGADYLVSLGVDVIVTDDGLQHYKLDRDVEICVLDGARMLGNGHLLPAGPLREARWRLKTVNTIVVTGAVANLGYFPMMLKPSSIEPLSLNSIENSPSKGKVCALAGIGNPERFYKTLEDCGYEIAEKINVQDHGCVPIEKIKNMAEKMPVFMTAKDAMKYQRAAQEIGLSNVFVVNVCASLSKIFLDDIVNKVKQANYKVNERRKRREAKGYKIESIEPIEKDIIEALERDAQEIDELQKAQAAREAELAEEARKARALESKTKEAEENKAKAEVYLAQALENEAQVVAANKENAKDSSSLNNDEDLTSRTISKQEAQAIAHAAIAEVSTQIKSVASSDISSKSKSNSENLENNDLKEQEVENTDSSLNDKDLEHNNSQESEDSKNIEQNLSNDSFDDEHSHSEANHEEQIEDDEDNAHFDGKKDKDHPIFNMKKKRRIDPKALPKELMRKKRKS